MLLSTFDPYSVQKGAFPYILAEKKCMPYLDEATTIVVNKISPSITKYLGSQFAGGVRRCTPKNLQV